VRIRIVRFLKSRLVKWTAFGIIMLLGAAGAAALIAPRPIANVLFSTFKGYSSDEIARFEQIPAAKNLLQNGFTIWDAEEGSDTVDFIRCPSGCSWHDPADDEQHVVLIASENPDGSFTTNTYDPFYMITVFRPDGQVNCTIDYGPSQLVDLAILPSQFAAARDFNFGDTPSTDVDNMGCTLHRGN